MRARVSTSWDAQIRETSITWSGGPRRSLGRAPEWDTLLQPDWNAVGLEQLDSPPRLLGKLKIDYPNSLVRKGIDSVNIEVDVMIDETGKVVLRQILGSPPAEIVEPLKTLINRARFTAPTKDGTAVRAAFIWPLEFSK